MEVDFNEISQLAANFDLIEIRHQYKKRKNMVIMSDVEYDEFIANFKNAIIMNHILIKVMKARIDDIDSNNKRVQKGKEQSIRSLIEEDLKKFYEELNSGEDQHHRPDLQPDGEGERKEGEEA